MMPPAPPRAPVLRPALTIARYTLLEAWRNRLPWLLVAIALAALGLASFAGALALTETRQVQAALLGALLRLAAAFLVATFVVTSMLREAGDKGLELLLALPVPRAAWLLGKLAGFFALASMPALLFGMLTLLFAPPDQAALWSASLLCELWIVAAFSVLCMLTLQQALPALAAALAFYLLARSIGTLQLLGSGAALRHDSGQRALGAGIDALALLLPHLDAFTRTDWLVYHTGAASALLPIALQTLLYATLLGACALFDLYRKAI